MRAAASVPPAAKQDSARSGILPLDPRLRRGTFEGDRCRGRNRRYPVARRDVCSARFTTAGLRDVGATASRKRRSCDTTTRVPSVSASACSSCSTASRSRWFVGSSRTSRLMPAAWSSARCARARRARALRRVETRDPRPARNFASSVRASSRFAETRREDVEQRLLRVVGLALLTDHAGNDPPPELVPDASSSSPRKARSNVASACPVRARDGDALAGENLDVEGSSRNDSWATTAPRASSTGEPTRPSAWSSRRSSHGSNGFSGSGFARAAAPPGAPSSVAHSCCVGRPRRTARPAPPRAPEPRSGAGTPGSPARGGGPGLPRTAYAEARASSRRRA